MTRRGAIIGAMLLAGGKLAADQNSLLTAKFPERVASKLTFEFGSGNGFSALEVRFGDGSVVTLTEADLKRELTHQHTPQRWGENSLFLVAGRRMNICAECGQTYWGTEARA